MTWQLKACTPGWMEVPLAMKTGSLVFLLEMPMEIKTVSTHLEDLNGRNTGAGEHITFSVKCQDTPRSNTD